MGVVIRVLAASLLVSGVAVADTLELSSGRDAVLYESVDGSLANGAGSYQLAGTNGEDRALRSLLAFDLSSVPDGAQITAASLALELDTPLERGGTLELHRLTSPWSEGPSDPSQGEGQGAVAQAGDSTWLHTSYDRAFWSTPGGDFAASVSGSGSFPGNGTLVIGSAGLALDVQGWLDDPLSDNGWLLQLSDESAPAVRWTGFGSGSPPLLTLEYIPVPEPAGGALLGLGLAGLAAWRRRSRPAAG